PVIVASRMVAVLVTSILGPEWKWFRLEPLNEAEMVDLVKLYLDAPAQVESLIESIKRVDALRSVASSPLLLSLVAVLFRRERLLPLTRFEIYCRVVESMLDRWEAEKGVRRESLPGRIA